LSEIGCHAERASKVKKLEKNSNQIVEVETRVGKALLLNQNRYAQR
jgi:hypothetical protein